MVNNVLIDSKNRDRELNFTLKNCVFPFLCSFGYTIGMKRWTINSVFQTVYKQTRLRECLLKIKYKIPFVFMFF